MHLQERYNEIELKTRSIKQHMTKASREAHTAEGLSHNSPQVRQQQVWCSLQLLVLVLSPHTYEVPAATPHAWPLQTEAL